MRIWALYDVWVKWMTCSFCCDYDLFFPSKNWKVITYSIIFWAAFLILLVAANSGFFVISSTVFVLHEEVRFSSWDHFPWHILFAPSADCAHVVHHVLRSGHGRFSRVSPSIASSFIMEITSSIRDHQSVFPRGELWFPLTRSNFLAVTRFKFVISAIFSEC